MVKAWREKVTIPTYEAGAPEKNPIFLEKRVYQGSSGWRKGGSQFHFVLGQEF